MRQAPTEKLKSMLSNVLTSLMFPIVGRLVGMERKPMDVQEEIEILERLGLTHNQAKVYLTLAKTGSSTANRISKISNVERSEIYRIMSTLGKLGLVEKTISSPVEFKSAPIEVAVRFLMNRRLNETSNLDVKIANMLREFKIDTSGSGHAKDESQFVMIPEKAASLERRREAIQNSVRSIDAVNSWKRLPLTTFTYVEDIKSALRRGVKIRIVTDRSVSQKESAEIEYLKLIPGFQVRYVVAQPRALVSIYDDKEVIMATSSTKGLGESQTLWSNNSSLLALAQGYFDTYWKNSKEISSK